MNINQFQQQFNLNPLSEEATDLFNGIPSLANLPAINGPLTPEQNLARTNVYRHYLGTWLINLQDHIKNNQHNIEEIRTCIALYHLCNENDNEVKRADEAACKQSGIKFEKLRDARSTEIIDKLNYLVPRLNAENPNNAPLSLLSVLPPSRLTGEDKLQSIVPYLDKYSIFQMSQVNSTWHNMMANAVELPSSREEFCDDEGLNYAPNMQISMSKLLQYLTEDLDNEEFLKILHVCRQKRGIFKDIIASSLADLVGVFAQLKFISAANRLIYLNTLPTGDEPNDPANRALYAQENSESLANGHYYSCVAQGQVQQKLPVIYAGRRLIQMVNACGIFELEADVEGYQDERGYYQYSPLVNEMSARHMSEEGIFDFYADDIAYFEPRLEDTSSFSYYQQALIANLMEKLAARRHAEKALVGQNAPQQDVGSVNEAPEEDETYNRAASTTQVSSTGKRKSRISDDQENQIDDDLENSDDQENQIDDDNNGSDDDNSNVNDSDSDNNSVNDDDNDDVDNLHQRKMRRI